MACVMVGCAGGTPPTPSPSVVPGTSPAASLRTSELGVCEATSTMDDGLTRLQAITLRRTSRRRLDQALEHILTGQDVLRQRATYRMGSRIRTLGIAVTNLILAVEDFQTTTRYDLAAANVRRSANAMGKAVRSFERWVGCDAMPEPVSVPSPGTGVLE